MKSFYKVFLLKVLSNRFEGFTTNERIVVYHLPELETLLKQNKKKKMVEL